jgi:hypothetical protein
MYCKTLVEGFEPVRGFCVKKRAGGTFQQKRPSACARSTIAEQLSNPSADTIIYEGFYLHSEVDAPFYFAISSHNLPY